MVSDSLSKAHTTVAFKLSNAEYKCQSVSAHVYEEFFLPQGLYWSLFSLSINNASAESKELNF